MKASKLTSKFQATVPKDIRDFLSLEKGDTIVFEIEDEKVVLKKATVFDMEWHQSLENTLSEWNTEEDNNAYESL